MIYNWKPEIKRCVTEASDQKKLFWCFVYDKVGSGSFKEGIVTLVYLEVESRRDFIRSQGEPHYSDTIMGAITSPITKCLLNRLFRGRSKKTSKLRLTGLCKGNSPVAGEFPAQRASNMGKCFHLWRHHAVVISYQALLIVFHIVKNNDYDMENKVSAHILLERP